MAGPWEKYQAQPQEDGPWSKYQSKPAARAAASSGPTMGDRIKRDLGLSTRNVVEGAGDLVGIVADPFIHAYNWLGEKGPTTKSLITGQPERRWERQETTREGWGRALDTFGVPRAETASERVEADVGRALTGTALTMGLGGVLNAGRNAAASPTIANRVGDFLTAQPTLQTISTATGSGASGIARENGAGADGQLAAGLAGGLTPGALTAGTQAVVRGVVRGGDAGRRRVASAIEDFRSAGTTPTVGQATQGRFARGAEQTLSRIPGGAGAIASKAAAQNDEIGDALTGMSRGLAPKSDATAAGRAIFRGVKAPGGFIDQKKATQTRLYDELDQHIKLDAHVDVGNTLRTLQDLTRGISGAPSTSSVMQTPRLQSIARSFLEDAGDGTSLPYDAVRRLRTMVGKELESPALAPDVKLGQWKSLYGALTEDMKAAALAAGPKAAQAWNRANTYTRAMMERLEAIEHVVTKNGGPEKVFQAAMSGTKEGATTLKAVMRSLPEDGRKQVSAAVLRRLGRAVDSQQDDLGEAFNVGSFLTNWNKLSAEAKGVLFNGYSPSFRMDMDKLARVASNLRSGSQVFANPPGTAAALAQVGGWTSLGTTALTAGLGGSVTPLAAVMGTMASARGLSNAMTSPAFVRWLAKTTSLPKGSLPAQIPVLRQIAESEEDNDMSALADQLEHQFSSSQANTQRNQRK